MISFTHLFCLIARYIAVLYKSKGLRSNANELGWRWIWQNECKVMAQILTHSRFFKNTLFSTFARANCLHRLRCEKSGVQTEKKRRHTDSVQILIFELNSIWTAVWFNRKGKRGESKCFTAAGEGRRDNKKHTERWFHLFLFLFYLFLFIIIIGLSIKWCSSWCIIFPLHGIL